MIELKKSLMADIKISLAIVLKQDRVLLIQRSLKEGSLNWQFPAGKIEGDESEMNAAERETYEETGIKCKAKEVLGSRIHPETGVLIDYVICNYLSGHAYRKDNRELKDVRWIHPKFLKSYIPVNNIFPPILEYFNIK